MDHYPFIHPYKYFGPWPSYFIQTYFTEFKYLGYSYGHGELWKYHLGSFLLLLLHAWVCFYSNRSFFKGVPVQCNYLTLAILCKLWCFLFWLKFYIWWFSFLVSQIQVTNVSRLCHAKPIVTVNGMFPGPTIYVREGDRVLVNVTNSAQYNMSIHW